jgi:uncharacterized protein (TIGR02594 family)
LLLVLAVNPFDILQRYVGLKELKEQGKDHPWIQWCFTLCGYGMNTPDSVPWCSAALQHPFWELRLPRSKSAAARSWLTVGRAINLTIATVGYDVVILKRAGDTRGPEVLDAPGHVGLYAGTDAGRVLVLAGNQGDQVSVLGWPFDQMLGIRRVD